MTRDVPPGPTGTGGLKRDPALVPLSRDHHFALRQVLWLQRAADGGDEGKAESVAGDYVAFHRAELMDHMADEEKALFPAAEAVDPEGTARLRREHAEVHELTAHLRATLDAAGDPRTLMREIASLLDDHIRYEERAFFMAVQQRLTPERLREVGREIERRRRARVVRTGRASRERRGP